MCSTAFRRICSYLRQQRAWHCLVSLSLDQDPAALDAAELLAKLQVHYEYEEIAAPPDAEASYEEASYEEASYEEPSYEEPWLQELLAEYRGALQDSHLSFPASGLRCLQSLAGLSQQGLLVLSPTRASIAWSASTVARRPGWCGMAASPCR